MELKQLRYFIAVAEELNFNRAASRLNITQPPLSRQIQQLEESIGARLFSRNNRGVELTDSGSAFLSEARRLLMLAEQAVLRTQLMDKGEAGRIDIGVFGSSTLEHIPRIIRKFRETSPNIVVGLHAMGKLEQIRALREGRLDIAFNRILPHEPDIEIETVLNEPLCLAVADSHPLAKMNEVSLSGLGSEQFILFPNKTRPSLADTIVRLCQTHGFEPRIAQETTDVFSCIALVATGFGISLVPQSATSLKASGVIYLRLAPPAPMLELCCLYRKKERSPVLQSFLESVRQYREGAE